MEISEKELRKLLNKAWDKRDERCIGWFIDKSGRQNIRYRDVSKIIKEAEKPKEAKP